MQQICKLCRKYAELRKSHFIPKFVVKWVKKTSITGYIRHSNNMHKRAQDFLKEYWLCAECEGLFSEWERSFANNVFYPFVDKNECVASYGSWLSKFCASISWRTLTYIRSKSSNDNKAKDYIDNINAAELHLAQYLLGQETNLCQYEQHLLPLEGIKTTTISALTANTNRYFLRNVTMDIIGNSTNIFIYTKLPSFIILGLVKTQNPQKMRSSRIALKHGKISPREYHWPKELLHYIIKQVKAISKSYDKIPEKQKADFEKYIKNNLEKAGNSKLFEAFTYDYEQFGDDVFRK